MKNKSLIISSICVSLAFCVPLSVSAKEKKSEASPAPSASPSAASSPSMRALPFHGMISAVDQSAKTFTIAGKEKSRVFKITDKTVITKDGNPATMSDLAEKEEVRGQYWKGEDGSLEAKTVKLGAKSEKAKKKSKKDKEEGASPSPTP